MNIIKYAFKNKLFAESSKISILKVISLFAGFIITMLLSRMLGARDYGLYAYILSWIGILAIPATMGTSQLLIREIAAYRSKNKFVEIVHIITWAKKIVYISAGVISIFWITLSILHFNYFHDLSNKAIILASAILLFISLTNLKSSILQGYNKVVIAIVPETIVKSTFFILLLTVIFIGHYEFNATTAILVQLMVTITVFVIISIIIRRTIPDFKPNLKLNIDRTPSLKSALPFLLLGGTEVIHNNTDIVMLGIFKNPTDVGIYKVAVRVAALLLFFLMSFNRTVQPLISQYFADNEKKKLQNLLTKSARYIVVLTLPIFFIFFVFGNSILHIFGNEFISGTTALRIICIGQLANVFAGSVGVTLNMTGNERFTLKVFSLSTLINVILNFILIPNLGIEGAAIATSVSLVFWNISLIFGLWFKLKINPTAIAIGGR